MAKDKSGAFNIAGAYVSCLLGAIWILDFIDIFGRGRDPEALSHFACAILPLTKIASPLVSEHLVNFSIEKCLAPPIPEPATSIIFFMGKITLTFMAASYYGLIQILTDFPETKQKLSFYKADGGDIVDVIKYKAKGTAAFAMIYLAILIPFKTLPTQFGTDIPRKGSEDLSSLVLFMCLVLFADTLSASAFYLKSHSEA